MKTLSGILFSLTLAVVGASLSYAQTPATADILVPCSDGVCQIRFLAPPDDDTAQVCLNQIEPTWAGMGCQNTEPGGVVTFGFPQPDLEEGGGILLKGRAVDHAGNVSNYSQHGGRVSAPDTTPPAPPILVECTWIEAGALRCEIQ